MSYSLNDLRNVFPESVRGFQPKHYDLHGEIQKKFSQSQMITIQSMIKEEELRVLGYDCPYKQ